MNKINLDLLFPHIKSEEALSVNNLYTETKVPFNTSILVQKKEHRRMKIKNCYKGVLNNCYRNIREANNIGKTDIIFSIPRVMVQNIHYNQSHCQIYIEKKLKELKIDTLRLNDYQLFITWVTI